MKSLVALVVVALAFIGMAAAIWFLMHFPWQHKPPSAPPAKQISGQQGG
jgi:hypothetical protein